MNNAINTYKFMRAQCGAYPVDACTDSAQFHKVNVYELAAALIAANIDAKRLSII